MILVADASALIALAACESLYLLDALFGTVRVPEAVYFEVAQADKPYSQRLQHYLQDKTLPVNMGDYVYLDAFADTGETAAMLLYKQLHANYLLIDDKRGRRVAAINQIATVGSLGVLLQAKRAKLVALLAPLLAQIETSPVFISPSLLTTVLELAGESPANASQAGKTASTTKGT